MRKSTWSSRRSVFIASPFTVLAFLMIASFSCAGKQTSVQDSETCKQQLSSCQFTVESLKAQNRNGQAVESHPDTGNQRELEEWRASFSDISEKLEAMFRGYDYSLSIDNGTLVFALPVELLFQNKKAMLTEKGKEVALRINQIAKQLEDRRIVVSCRSVDLRLDNPSASAASDRELSFKRAMTFTTKLVKTGIDPTSLGAAGYPGDLDGETGEGEGWFELHVLPHPHEMPLFPDDFIPHSQYAEDASETEEQSSW